MKHKFKHQLLKRLSWQRVDPVFNDFIDEVVNYCFDELNLDKIIQILPFKDSILGDDVTYYQLEDEKLSQKVHSCHHLGIGLMTCGKTADAWINRFTEDTFKQYIVHEAISLRLFNGLVDYYCTLASELPQDEGMFVVFPGDDAISLSIQAWIFDILKPKHITLDKITLLMHPLKTLSFIIGFKKGIPVQSLTEKCATCQFPKCDKPNSSVVIKIDNQDYCIPYHTNLLDVLMENHILIDKTCNGKGQCGKCRVLIEENGAWKNVLACQTDCNTALNIKTVSNIHQMSIETNTHFDMLENANGKEGYGIAIDIGTTTIVIAMYNIFTKKQDQVLAFVNQQYMYGVDVISRIEYAIKNQFGLTLLHQTLINQINQALQKTKHNHLVEEIIIVGNPTMISICQNKQIASIGMYPFVCEVMDTLTFHSSDLGINANANVIFPYAISAFVGSDVIVGILASGMHTSDNYQLLIDLGTNGEIVVGNKDSIFVCSTAAGPAFEGGGISCGVASIPGAITHYHMTKTKTTYKTIQNEPAIGFCGTGIIDVMAQILNLRLIDRKGALISNDNEISLTADNANFTLKQQDIRAFQLAKSAIQTGIALLLQQALLTYDQIENIMVSGGFGSHLNAKSLVEVGLIPKMWQDKLIFLGNSALHGATLYLLQLRQRQILEDLKSKMTTVDLATNPDFESLFIKNLSFNKRLKP